MEKTMDPQPAAETQKKSINPVAFSLGEFGLGIAGNVVGLLSLFFYADVMGLSASLAALARTINGVWDGVNDPLFGYFSDRRRNQWGRKPWLMVAFPIFLIANVLFWRPPDSLSQSELFAYFLTLLLLFETTATIGWVNYNSLFPDMFRGEQRRTRVNAIRKAIGVVALIAGAAVAPILYDRLGFAAMGVIVSGIAAVALITFLIVVREDRRAPASQGEAGADATAGKPPSLISSFSVTLRNKSYLRYVGVYALFVFAQLILGTGIPFYAKYSLHLDEASTSLLFVSVFAIGIPGVFLWVWLQRRIGSRLAWILSLVMFAIGIIPFGWVASLPMAMLGGALAGLGMTGTGFMGDLFLGDIIDEDAEMMGMRREGVFYSVLPIPARLSSILAAAVFSLLTPIFGYVSGDQPGSQPDTAFRYFMTILPLLAVVIAVFIARGYHGKGKPAAGATPETA